MHTPNSLVPNMSKENCCSKSESTHLLKVCISLNETYTNICIIQYTYINLAVFCISHLDINKKMLFSLALIFAKVLVAELHTPKKLYQQQKM